MKVRTKDRAKKIGLIVIFIVIVVLVLSLLIGRSRTVSVVYLAEDGLVLGKDLAEQKDLFETMEMSEEEFKVFNGQIATSFSQLEGKMAIYNIAVGTPITASSLQKYNGGGVFVAKMPEGRTVYQMIGVKNGLPQLDDGDKVNVVLVYKEKNDEDYEQSVVSLIMDEISVYRQTETDLYLDVTLEQNLALVAAAQKGTFVIQVPGKMTVKNSSDKKEVDFKKTITVDELMSAIESGKYYSDNYFKDNVTTAKKDVETKEKEVEEEDPKSTTTESGGEKQNAE